MSGDEQIPASPDAWIRQNEHPRCVVDGRRTDGSGKCTVIALRTPDGYDLYPHGADGMCVHLGREAADELGAFLRGAA